MGNRKPPGKSQVNSQGKSRGGTPAGPRRGAASGARPKAAAGGPSRAASRRIWLYGAHAVGAALANPRRQVWRLIATREAAGRLARAPDAGPHDGLVTELAGRAELERLLPPDAVHQGLALEVSPIAQADFADLLGDLDAASASEKGARRLIVALDQVSDPRNAGAILRSAAAFGAAAVIVPRHGGAPESGALAKAASGGLEVVPYLEAGNLTRALESLKDRDFQVLGLAAEADRTLSEALAEGWLGDRLVLALGAEGKGLRRLIRESCDLLVRLPTRPPIDQLNVSNAAAVALYELLGRRIGRD